MHKNALRILFILMLIMGIPATILAQDSIGTGDSVTDTASAENVEYTIDLSAGDTVEITLEAEDFDTLVKVLDADGTELAEDDDSAGNLNSLLTFEAPADGTYTILVTSFFGEPEGEFTLSVSGGDAGGDGGKEGSGGGEGDLAVGDSITESADGDIAYTIELEADQTIAIDLSSEDFDTLVEVFDADDNSIAEDDDGGEGFNSRLIFTAPTSGLYAILVTSFAGEAEGTFTLSIEESGSASGDSSAIEYGQTLEITPDGAVSTIITFEGEAGDVINLYAVTSTDEDSRMYLYGPDGSELAQDDDSGEGSNPYIRRFMLPDSGTYEIDLQGFGESALEDPIDVTLELTELVEITADGVVVSLGESAQSDVLAYTTEDDVAYVLSVDADEDLESTLYIELLAEDEDYAATRFNVSGASSFAAVFTADDTGLLRVKVDYYGFRGDTDFTISIEPLE